MIPRSNRGRDHVDQDVPLDPRLITDLQAAYRRPPPRAAVDDTIRRAVAARVAQQDVPARRRMPRRWHPRLSVAMVATVLLSVGLGTYLHRQSPTPVSAQTILHRAAAVTSVPNEATHSTYRITASGGYTGTIDVWVGTDAQGAPSEFAMTASMSLNGQPDPGFDHRGVMTNQESQAYDPVRNTITITSPPSGEDQQFEGVFVAALIAQTMNKCPAAVQQRTLDGVPVYALRFEESNQAVYFNTQTYVLEGSDWTQNWEISSAWHWHARLDPSGYHTMPLSAVPPHTFSLNAPATAQVERETSPQPASGIQGCA
jgi:hypothetical protein